MKTWMGIGLAAVLIAGGSYYWYEHGRQAKESPAGDASNGDAQAGETRVEVAHPREGGLEIASTNAGSVHAFEHADLFAKVSGYLKVQKVDIGDPVKRGQLLAEIDDPEIHKAVDQSRAARSQAKAKVSVAEAMIRTAVAEREAAEATAKQAESEVRTQEINHEYRVKQYNRIYGLVQRGSTEAKLLDESKDQLDSASAAVNVAQAAVLAAKATVSAKQAKIEQAKADLDEARSKVEMAQADLARAEVLAGYTLITSPYDGVISRRTFHRGDFVHSAAESAPQPLLSVDRVDLMRVVFPIPDREVQFLDKGDPVVIKINALRGREFHGTISRFAMIEDPESRNMRTEVDLPNPDGKLHPGMFGTVRVVLQKPNAKSVTVPSSALVSQDGNGDGIVYLVRDGKARKQPVRVGFDNGSEAEIDEGLSDQDEVIIRYNGAIGDGSPVRVETAQKERPTH